mgnify:CR=1 FL=1
MGRTMWAVGPDDGEGWVAINAPTEDAAIQAYATENDCTTDYVVANRVEGWDGLKKITGPDWLRNGHGFSCSACDEMAFAEDGGVIVNEQVFCEGCAPESSA